VRRPAVLAAAVGALTVLLRRRSQARRAEQELWTEAAVAPDLRRS
jgi:hypothetical protein